MSVDQSIVRRLRDHGVASAVPALRPIAEDAVVHRAVDDALGADLARLAPDGATPVFDVPILMSWPRNPESGAASSGAVDASGWMIVRPSAEGESRPLPHAEILHRSDDPRSPAELVAMLAIIRGALGHLGVDRMALFIHGEPPSGGLFAPAVHALPGAVEPEGDGPQTGRRLRVSPYKRYPAAAMDALPTPAESNAPHARSIVSERPTDLSFYPEYESMYESFWRSHPELGAKIGIESRAAIEEYAAHDGLRLMRVDGELAGVFAAIRCAEFGMRGWRVRERILAEGHRGAGLGAATLRAFVRSLDHDPGDLVWGTILPDNIGSLRSAEKFGRTDIGGLVWIDLDG